MIYKLIKELFYYPKFRSSDADYSQYWRERKITKETLNSFQKKRADLVIKYIESGSVLLDVGVSNGAVLAYIHKHKPMSELIGVDISADVLNLAQQNGVKVIKSDISDLEKLKELPAADYICFFEVLEHMPQAEELLQWATGRAAQGVFFSVPNTGHISHRLRLLFGRFPLQWRVRPSEHVRFWTLRDMHWWLKQLGFTNYVLKLYEGTPFLNKIWPHLFAKGIWVYIPKR